MRALIASLALAVSVPAYAEPAPDITGEWRGRYVCNQGLTALQLTIQRRPDGGLAATFMFGPLPENPTVPKGAYVMSGTFDPATREMALEGVGWLNLPRSYVMVGLEGRISASGDRLFGLVPGPGCTWFELRRMAPLIG